MNYGNNIKLVATGLKVMREEKGIEVRKVLRTFGGLVISTCFNIQDIIMLR